MRPRRTAIFSKWQLLPVLECVHRGGGATRVARLKGECMPLETNQPHGLTGRNTSALVGDLPEIILMAGSIDNGAGGN